jgi:hypothetical protein
MSGYKRIDPQIREQILTRIKNEGVTAMKAANDAGVSPKTVYGWLASKARAGDPIFEINRLKRDLEQAQAIIGKFTIEMEKAKKKGAL